MDTVDFFPIEVEQTNWETSQQQITAIRYTVFVTEQQVPIEEELDEHDPLAVHWLVYGPDDVPMATGRLLQDGTVGRLAVLSDFRDKGVGSSLMRRIIRFALRQGMEQLQLSSQLQAMPFYRGFYFIPEGAEFLDGGIPHRKMTLNLSRYRHAEPDPTKQSKLPDISNEERQRVAIDGVGEFHKNALLLIDRAERDIRIFSSRLEPALYSDQELCDAIFRFCTSHQLAEVRILLRDLDAVKHHSNLLHELALRLPSRIQIRKLTTEIPSLHSEFLLVDQAGILYKQEPERFVGYAIPYAPLEAVELRDEFDMLWEQSEPDPEFRRLHI